MTVSKFLRICAAVVFGLALLGFAPISPVLLGLFLWVVSTVVE